MLCVALRGVARQVKQRNDTPCNMKTIVATHQTYFFLVRVVFLYNIAMQHDATVTIVAVIVQHYISVKVAESIS